MEFEMLSKRFEKSSERIQRGLRSTPKGKLRRDSASPLR